MAQQGLLVAIGDPVIPTREMTVNSDGSINVTGTITATNPSVGSNGAAIPTSSTQVGWKDGSGNLQPVSAATPLPISGSLSLSESVTNVTGSASSAAVLTNFPVNPTTGYRSVAVQVTAIAAASTLICEQSNDGTTWTGVQTPTDAVVETASPMTATGLYLFPITALQFRVRQSVYGGSGTSTVNAEFRQAVGVAVAQATVVVAGSLPAGSNVIGTVTANAGTNLNTSALALDTSVNGILVAQNSTTSGQTGPLAQAAVTTSAPSYTTAKTSPLSLTTAGALRTDSSAVTQPVSAASLPLPTGASTAAKQPALGTAGTAASDVITVQGIASMTKLLVTPDALPANQSVNVAQVGGNTVVTGGTNGSQGVGGLAASGASVAGNPLLGGGRGATANPSAVTDGQAVAAMLDKVGRQVVVSAVRNLVASQKTTISNSTAETTIVTAIASTFCDILSLVFANSGTSTTKVDIRDTTGGSIITTFEVPTTDMRGIVYQVPLPQTTVNTNWTAQCTTATTALEVTAQYVKNI